MHITFLLEWKNAWRQLDPNSPMQFFFGIFLQIYLEHLVQDQKLSSALLLNWFRCLELQGSFENSNWCAGLTLYELCLRVSGTIVLMCSPLSMQQKKNAASLALMLSRIADEVAHWEDQSWKARLSWKILKELNFLINQTSSHQEYLWNEWHKI